MMSAPTIRKAGWSLAAALLLAPAIAMQLTSEMNWGPGDFVAAALIIGGIGLGLEGAARLQGRTRLIAGALAVMAGLAVWAELAVGILD
ncbi:MAG: hypothetical protein RIS17_1707 [Pseudomonadota bacterium]|jgi:hypothetical protein